MTFTDLPLAEPLLTAVAEQGYETPSAIQQQAIPVVLQGHDVMAQAQTGTGKTAGFTLPVLHNLLQGKPAGANKARVLILTPTRELAAQVHDSVRTYGKHVKLRSTVVFGGVKINPQMMKLRQGVDVLVATPGRLLDLYNQNAVKFDALETLVLDEADRMLDMGFIHDIRKIVKSLPKQRQTLLFSATFSDEIMQLSHAFLQQPVHISVTPRNTTVETIKQWLCPVDKKRKADLLIHLIKEQQWQQVLVFSRTKHGANKLVKTLGGQNIQAAAIHGNKSQSARTKALADFKQGVIQVLVATDIAARGIDIDLLPNVVNFDLPNVPEDYVHRIGRTGRAGASGQAVSLVSADEIDQLRDIERLIKKLIPREFIDGFIPVHDLPESKLNTKPFKPKKPKKPKLGHRDGRRDGHQSAKGKQNNQSRRNNQKSQAKDKPGVRTPYKGKKSPYKKTGNRANNPQ